VSSVTIASIVFAFLFAGALLGMFLRTALPDHHLNTDTKDAVKVAIALVATMGALVLSLLISTAKSAYDTRSSEFVQMSADIVLSASPLGRGQH
jgi:fluoride ion exporter CrcB/FEX